VRAGRRIFVWLPAAETPRRTSIKTERALGEQVVLMVRYQLLWLLPQLDEETQAAC
jgi:hypothetical protein